MQVASLLSAVPNIMTSGLRMLSGEHSAATADSDVDAESQDEGASLGVDFTSISPDDFSKLIDQLRKSGNLSAEAYDDLLGVRLEMDRVRAPKDQPIDVLALLQNKLSARPVEAGAAANDGADLTKRQLQWLESISSQRGVNALA